MPLTRLNMTIHTRALHEFTQKIFGT